MRRPALFALVLLAVSACAYRIPRVEMDSHLPAIGPHEMETYIDVDDRTKTLDEEDTANVRKKTDELLRSAAAKRQGHEHAVVRAHVVIQDEINGFEQALHQDGCALVGAPGLLTGVKYTAARVAVDVTIVGEGGTWTARGVAMKEGSVYAPARKRALAAALNEALANASL
jgi:hypothetical protein